MIAIEVELAKVKAARYLSVYGAMIALQVRDRLREGRGAPDYDDMRRYVEEARAVAQMSEDVQP